jgi:hypothetical protein
MEVIPTLTIVAVLHGVAAVILLLFVVVIDAGRVVNEPEDDEGPASPEPFRRFPLDPDAPGLSVAACLPFPFTAMVEGSWRVGNGDDANEGGAGWRSGGAHLIYRPGQPLRIPRSGVCRCLPGVPRNSSKEKPLDLLRPMGGG